MKEKKNVILGFDLGVGSVGWAIVDSETNDIIKLGSRLFNEPELAADRRGFRGIRRLIRRRQYRNDKFYRLILKYKNIFGFGNRKDIEQMFVKLNRKYSNILELKILSLNKQINVQELAWLLHDYLENRGYFYEDVDSLEEIEKNDVKTTLFPSQILFNFYKKYGTAKSFNSYIDDEFRYNFSNKNWLHELNKLFEIQKTDANFINDYLKIFTAIRPYAKGPGSINSYSEYGRFKYKDNKLVEAYSNIWEKTIGKCSIFPLELRAAKNCASHEIFNILNELNNLKNTIYPDWRLTKENKLLILNDLLNEFSTSKTYKGLKTKTLIPFLEAYCLNNNLPFSLEELNKIDNQGFTGFKYNKETTKPEFVEIRNIFEIIRVLAELDINTTVLNFNDNLVKQYYQSNLKYEPATWITLFNKIVDTLNNFKDKENRIEKLNGFKELFVSIFNDITNEKLINIIEILATNKKIKSSATASLSLKALNLFWPEMLSTNSNFEQLKFNPKFFNKEDSKNNFEQTGKYINLKNLDNQIIPTSVKATIREAIGIFNKIKKLYSSEFNITKVVVELAREKNDKEQRDTITKINNINKKRKEDAIKLVNDLEPNLFDKGVIEKKAFKVFLYQQQDGRDPYSGQFMNLPELIKNDNYCEIDHILPYSKSANDSISNKVLVLKSSNQIKGNRIPYDYFQNTVLENGWNWQKYKNWAYKVILNGDLAKFSNKNQRIQKYNNLVKEKFDEYDQLDFLSRNLNDTRYATKYFRDLLGNYSKNHNDEFRVICMNGSVTSYFRKKACLIKDRDDYSHHAQDASIIAIIANKSKSIFNLLLHDDRQISYMSKDGTIRLMDKETGEIIEEDLSPEDPRFNKTDLAIQDIAETINEKIANTIGDVMFSRKTVIKTNPSISDQTIYGYRKISEDSDEILQIQKLNLFEVDAKNKKSKENVKLSDFFGENPKLRENLLIYKSHKSEYEKLNNIYMQYKEKNEKAPFTAYMKDLTNIAPEIFTANLINNYMSNGKVVVFDPTSKKQTFVKHLKYFFPKTKNMQNVLLNKKQKNKSFYENLNSIGALVYINKKGTYDFIGINALLLKFNMKNGVINYLDENIYDLATINAYKVLKNIDVSSKPVHYLFVNGTILQKKSDNNLFIVVGMVPSNGTIELKCISMSNANYFSIPADENGKRPIKRIRLSINSIMNEYIVCSVDVLGNIYKPQN